MEMSFSKLQELVIEGKPGVLHSMGLQSVGHNWATQLNWYIYQFSIYIYVYIYYISQMFFIVLSYLESLR